MYQISAKIRQPAAELLMIQPIVAAVYRGRLCIAPFSELCGPNNTKLGEGIGHSSELPKFCYFFRHIAPFRNPSVL